MYILWLFYFFVSINSESVFAQLLTDNDFQQLRVKQAYANVQPKRAQSRDMKVFAALEEESFYVRICTSMNSNTFRTID
jgi:hypothetical protein